MRRVLLFLIITPSLFAQADLAPFRHALEEGAARLPEVEARWRERLKPTGVNAASFAQLFGYDPPRHALSLAFLAGFLFEQGGDEADAVRAARLLARYADYRSEYPPELAQARVEYAGELPATTNFFHLPDFAETWARIRSSPAIGAERRTKIESALAGSADFVLVFPEWGAHNRAILRALGLASCAAALPDHPRAGDWSKMAEILADDSQGAWEVEDAQHYHPIWLHALLRYARVSGDERVYASPQVRTYLAMYVALLAPGGFVPDFGDGWWRSSLRDYYACFALGAAGTGDPELAWAAERVRTALPAEDPEAPSLGEALLRARLFDNPPLPAPREPDPARTRVDDVIGKKVVLRTGWDDDDLYLLLNYRDEGDWGRLHRDYLRQTLAVEHEKMHHGHADENAIVAFMDGGSVLMHDAGYRDAVPSGPNGAWRADVFHNRLVVRPRVRAEGESLRELLLDEGHYRPVRTDRIDFLHFELGTYARTRVDAGEAGWVWDRTLFLTGEPRVVVVVDSVLVTRAGEYTFANLFAVGELVGAGADQAVGRTVRIGRHELAHTRNLIVAMPGEELASFPLSRHGHEEQVVHAVREGRFERGERLAFVTLLWPVEPGTDAGTSRIVPTSVGDAAVAVEIDSLLTILVKTDLEHGLLDEQRPRYTPERGRVEANGLATDADFLVVRRSGAEARWGASNMTHVHVGAIEAFAARPFQVFQTSGRSDVVGRAKWRKWEGTTWLD